MLLAVALGTALGTAHAYDCAPDETDPTALGSGTRSDPWQLCTVAQLAELEAYPAGHFELVADIDMESLPGGLGFYCPLQSIEGGFEGSFNGNGHTLSNLRGEQGLFTCINGGRVEDLHLENVDLMREFNTYPVGGLVGFMDAGSVSRVSVTGMVENGAVVNGGSDGVFGTGGVGGHVFDSKLERVSFEGEVYGSYHAGGIVGLLVRSDISDCSALGDVTGIGNIGGLVGTWSSVYDGTHLRRCLTAVRASDTGRLPWDPRVGLLVGQENGLILGSDDEESWDTVFALASGDMQLVGSTTYLDGIAIAADRAVLLDPTSYERAGWDLETVWTEPTPTSLPQLR